MAKDGFVANQRGLIVKIKLFKERKHADEIYPINIPAGEYRVSIGTIKPDISSPENGVVSKRFCEVALNEGWAGEINDESAQNGQSDDKEQESKEGPGNVGGLDSGHQSPESGQGNQQSLSDQDQALQDAKSKKSKAAKAKAAKAAKAKAAKAAKAKAAKLKAEKNKAQES